MHNMAMLNIVSKTKRFKKLFENKELLNEIIVKLNNITNSEKLYYACRNYINKQNDLHRYMSIAKMYASTPMLKFKYSANITDKNLMVENPEDILKSDTLSFYKELDDLTDGKFNLLRNVESMIDSFEFSKDKESHIGYEVRNGKRGKYIYINTQPRVENRLACIHEAFHGINEIYAKDSKINRNEYISLYPHTLALEHMNFERSQNGQEIVSPYESSEYNHDQFTGEITSMIIEKIAQDYLLRKYADDKEFVDAMEKYNKIYYNWKIAEAKSAYLDQLIVLAIAGGNKKIKGFANKEIINQTDRLWSLKALIKTVYKLDDVANNKTNFIPQYSLRYVIGDIVAEQVYQQYKEASAISNKEDRKVEVAKILEKIINLNNNIVNVHNLKREDSQAKNQVDIITEYFELDNIETLAEQQSSRVAKFHENIQSLD